MTAQTTSRAKRTYAIESVHNGTGYMFTIWHMSRSSANGYEIDARKDGFSDMDNAERAAREIIKANGWKAERF